MNKKLHFTKIERLAVLIALVAHLLAAYFSYGYHHLDEHYQIWEWANYYLNLSPDRVHLPWEYNAQIRPWFQPFIHALGMKVALLLNIFNPFSFACFARMLYAVANVGSLMALWKTTRDQEKLNPLWFLLISTLWFFPYIHARTSSENLAGIFLTLAFAHYLRPSSPQENPNKKYWITGTLFGFSFLARYQIALGLFGFGLFLLYRDRKILSKHLWLGLGFIIPVSIGFGLDRIGYGHWVNAPYRYFTVNLVQGVAASFNPYPWYQYFVWIAELNPFVSLPLFFGFLLYIYKRKIDALSSFVLSFFIVHCLIVNKEYRFLFPVLNLVPFMAAIGLNQTFPRLIEGARKKRFYAPYIVITLIAFSVSSLRGASLNTLWLVHVVHQHFVPGQMVLANREYVEKPQTNYYTLPPHPHFTVHSVQELEDQLKLNPKSQIAIDGNLDDQITQDLWQIPKNHSCKLLNSAFPLFFYENRERYPILKRLHFINFLVLYQCD